jgi:hypothetical protein
MKEAVAANEVFLLAFGVAAEATREFGRFTHSIFVWRQRESFVYGVVHALDDYDSHEGEGGDDSEEAHTYDFNFFFSFPQQVNEV